MNCAKAEREIYLYRELTSRERQRLDRHLSGCAGCQAIMERISNEQVTLQKIRDIRPPVPDHERITRAIMSEVLERKRTERKFINPIRLKGSAEALRYAMVTVSLILLGTFALEYNSGAGSPLVMKRFPPNARTPVALNSASFYKSFLTEKKQPASRVPSIYECLDGCMKGTEAACTDCDKFSKF